MNGTAHAIEQHPDDGILLRFVDGECEAGERADVSAHLAACLTCHARLDAFRSLSTAVSRHLGGDQEVRPRGTRRFPILRAAAVILFIGAAAASAQPISRWISRLTSHAAAGRAGTPGEPMASDSSGAVPGHARISFVPAGATLRIVFRAAQPAGSLVLAPSGDSSVAFVLSDGSVPPAVTVLPSGLVIANTPTDTVSYRITVPDAVTDVSLGIAGHPPERVAWHPADGTRTITLAATRH